MNIVILVRALYDSGVNTELPIESRPLVASRLAQGHTVVAPMLAARFQISEDAIRRDRLAWASERCCRRVHGGGVPLVPGATPMAARMDQDRERKKSLAQAAVETIASGNFLMLDNGSANLALAVCLPERHALGAATHAVDSAAAVDPMVGERIEATAVLAVGQKNVDRCFFGTCAAVCC